MKVNVNRGELPRRRSPIVAGLLGGMLTSWAGAAMSAQRFEFDVFLDDRPVGTHLFSVDGDPGSAAVVHSEAQFDVRVLGITVYRYHHRATEQWEHGCLSSLDANTLDNGHELRVIGRLGQLGFQLDQPRVGPALPACTLTYAYWDRDRLLRQQVLLNPQTGDADAVWLESLGRTQLVSRNGPLAAEQFRIHTDGRAIDLWYSLDGDWLQLQSTLASGRRLTYRRRDIAG
ncbi:MAG: hypothetical protein JSR36_12705 [Proteobacteria bacterium]|nr:hypothetical protein [Pseudomonadota bacterium]